MCRSMKPFFDYIEKFHFKNLFALLLCYKMLDLLDAKSSLRDILIVLLTLIIKHYFDSNTGAVKRDETISKALDSAQAKTASTVENADTVNVKK